MSVIAGTSELDPIAHARSAPTEEQLRWFVGGDTGLSSKSIWCHMTGTDPRIAIGSSRLVAPSDPSDMRRCMALLDRFPVWRSRMPEMAESFGPIAIHWEEVETLLREEMKTGAKAMRTWARMRDLAGEKPLAAGVTSTVTMTTRRRE